PICPDARAPLDLLRARDVPLHSTSEAVFAKLAFGERAEGLLAVVRIPSTALADLALPDDPLVVVIEGVEKPGNVGAVMRSADGAGADAVIAASPRTDLFTPNALRPRAQVGGPDGRRAAARGPGLARRPRRAHRRRPGRRRHPLHGGGPDRPA